MVKIYSDGVNRKGKARFLKVIDKPLDLIKEQKLIQREGYKITNTELGYNKVFIYYQEA